MTTPPPDGSADTAVRSVLRELAPGVILGGDAGVGKTTLALSLAIDAARIGESVTLIDLDIVNPYFRSGESRALLEAEGVRLLAPQFAEAGSNLDAPALTAAIEPEIEEIASRPIGRRLIIDLGGAVDGARTLGRFASAFVDSGVWGCYGVVNAFRPFADRPEGVGARLREYAAAARLELTAVIDNAHLMDATTLDEWRRGLAFARASAASAGCSLVMATVSRRRVRDDGEGVCYETAVRANAVKAGELIYPIRLYPTCPWERAYVFDQAR